MCRASRPGERAYGVGAVARLRWFEEESEFPVVEQLLNSC